MCIPEVYKSLMLAKKLINIETIASSYHMLNVTDYILCPLKEKSGYI